ncbi:DUF58 domain-containing protein [Aquimarina sp. U1-2]|nr:DUF58 domain-containing protein [Aquimarina sp. U1-2]
MTPEYLKTVSGLALIAKIVVEGYLSGRQHSYTLGSGMQFDQYRSYQPGDDLRLLDWKMLARSGKYYLKQSEIESNIAVTFILDTSASMLHTENGVSKLDIAKVIIAALGYISKNQGDMLGLYALNDLQLHNMYPKAHTHYYNRLLQSLIHIEGKGKWPSQSNEFRHFRQRNQKELIFFISDLYERDDEISSFLKQLKTSKNEVVVFHLMGEKELNFSHKGLITFEDLETGVKLRVDAKSAKKEYLQALERMIKQTKHRLADSNIAYHLFRLDENIGEGLQFFLQRRSELM